LLGLIFDNESDYDKIQENDTINFTDLVDFAPKTINIRIRSEDGSKDLILANHTYKRRIGWFVAGSALNLIAAGKA
jgi:aconitate hydratase